ncbi:hypothetical protein [Aliamphritea spongicola]|nr:hypothetical protein [Aliamphritea spongicola]
MALDQRRLNAIARLGCHMDYNHINHHSVPAPCFGNPSPWAQPLRRFMQIQHWVPVLTLKPALRAGRSPDRIRALLGLHLPGMRRPKRRFHLTDAPQTLTEWGALGAVIGGMLKNIDDIPLISGISAHPGHWR